MAMARVPLAIAWPNPAIIHPTNTGLPKILGNYRERPLSPRKGCNFRADFLDSLGSRAPTTKTNAVTIAATRRISRDISIEIENEQIVPVVIRIATLRHEL